MSYKNWKLNYVKVSNQEEMSKTLSCGLCCFLMCFKTKYISVSKYKILFYPL